MTVKVIVAIVGRESGHVVQQKVRVRGEVECKPLPELAIASGLNLLLLECLGTELTGVDGAK